MKKYSIGLFFACVFHIGCGGDYTLYSYTAGTGTYSIFGYVYLIDSTGQWQEKNDGILITAEGGPQSAFTQTNGIFLLRGLPAGSFTLIISKPGFAESHVEFFKNNDSVQYCDARELYQIRSVTPNIVLRPFDDGNGSATSPNSEAKFTSRIIDSVVAGNKISVEFFFGKNPLIQPSKPGSYQYSSGMIVLDTQKIASITVSRNDLLYSGFQPGAPIFVTAYAATTPNGSYRDTVSNKWIYTGFSPNHSEVKSFILP